MKTIEESCKWVLSGVSDLSSFSAEFRDYCEEKQLSEDKIFELEVSLEELIVNSFSHGYQAGGENGNVTVEVEDTGGDIKISLFDKAPPFDLLRDAPAPRLGGEDPEPEQGTAADAADLPDEAEAKEKNVGGLGIHLVKNLNDRVEYYGSQDGNIVVIIKSKT